ncbi:MAG: MBL fold metallo-hydrolase [Gammaproteobacteria bacterium]
MAWKIMSLLVLAVLAVPAVCAGGDTRVVILGTGTPVPDHSRAGAGVAVIHKGEAYLFDAGGGVVKRAEEAHATLGIKELEPTRIRHLFFTHLHSDHIHDYSELSSALWWRREQRLQAWGPKGLAEMTEGMHKKSRVEAVMRARGTPKEVISDPENYRVDVTEIDDGIVFRKDDLTIEAFTVPHGDIKPAFGYKITTDDKSIVISGDTAYSEKVIEMARSVDILIHEVISAKAIADLSEFWQQYHKASHTTTDQVAEVARMAKPGVLVLTHILFFGTPADELLEEVKAGYDGKVILAKDLQVF